MSGRRKNSPKLDLKLNLSPPMANDERVKSPNGSTSSCSSSLLETSPKSSCISSDYSDEEIMSSRERRGSILMVVGCPRCLMYVMLSDVNLKCPKCKSTVLLNFLPSQTTNNPTNSSF